MKRIAVLSVLLLLAAVPLIPAAQAQMPTLPQFSADMHVSHAGGRGESVDGKVYFGGKKIRMDMNSQGHEMEMINDLGAKTSYMIMPQQQMYMEFHAGAMGPMGRQRMPDLKPAYDFNNPCANQQGVTCKKLGTETINGRACDKWEFTESSGTQTAWIDQKLHFPIKTLSSDGSSMEMTNIKEGTQDASLFEVPAGYRKMDMPGMMGGPPRN